MTKYYKNDIYQWFLIFGLVIYLLIYLDFYFLENSNEKEVVNSVNCIIHGSRKKFKTFNFETNNAKYRIYENFYNKLNINDTVIVYRTFILNAKAKVALQRNQFEKFPIDLITIAQLLPFFIIFSLFGFFVFLIGNKLTSPQKSKNLLRLIAFILALLSITLIIFY
jgi:hypothetical protein